MLIIHYQLTLISSELMWIPFSSGTYLQSMVLSKFPMLHSPSHQPKGLTQMTLLTSMTHSCSNPASENCTVPALLLSDFVKTSTHSTLVSLASQTICAHPAYCLCFLTTFSWVREQELVPAFQFYLLYYKYYKKWFAI